MRPLRIAAVATWMVTQATAFTVPDNLTVVVFDYASVPHELLVSAVKVGRHAFRTSGIETNWILCDPVQGCYVPGRFVQVKILSRPSKSMPLSPTSLAATTICSTTDHCSASYVFYDKVLAFSGDASSPVDLTLAYVMAHEIGHQMGLGHKPGGIMTASFTPHDLHYAAVGWLIFAQDDARALRAAVARTYTGSDPVRHIKLSASAGE
jgi:hypothetical protein